jgi:hypothetical protein
MLIGVVKKVKDSLAEIEDFFEVRVTDKIWNFRRFHCK